MTVGELFEKIRTLMPSDRPNSLSSQSYREIVAFILQSNKFPPTDPAIGLEILTFIEAQGVKKLREEAMSDRYQLVRSTLMRGR